MKSLLCTFIVALFFHAYWFEPMLLPLMHVQVDGTRPDQGAARLRDSRGPTPQDRVLTHVFARGAPHGDAAGVADPVTCQPTDAPAG